MAADRIRRMTFASLYPMYVAKAEKKGRTQAEVDAVIFWLTGLDADGLARHLSAGTDLEHFFAEVPALNPARALITGKVCGVDVQQVEDPLMREIRFLDKLVDELAKGRPMAKILRQA